MAQNEQDCKKDGGVWLPKSPSTAFPAGHLNTEVQCNGRCQYSLYSQVANFPPNPPCMPGAAMVDGKCMIKQVVLGKVDTNPFS